jgi:uncharacterized protein YlxP (DUF503 family)
MSVAVGVCRVKLRLPENHSLKGKRQVLRSVVARLHSRFNVSVAEVGSNDAWQIAEIGISCIANDERHAGEVLAKVVGFIREERLDAELLEVETEILRGLD